MLQINTKIIIHSTNSKLDGKKGTIYGQYTDNLSIVCLNELYENQRAIVLSNSCLRPLADTPNKQTFVDTIHSL
jgi:hypothetical protein